jgi:ubiquinone/menaquinone biosynthesis C-methylase UbiE
MNNEAKSIHEFEYELIAEYYSLLDRQGIGSPEATRKALSFVEELTAKSKIIDIGCGTGAQTIEIAKHTKGQITAIDLFPNFISILNSNAEKHQLQNRVKGKVGNMEELPFQEDSIDLIWCEGAIYNIGFERGLKEWHNMLKKGAYIVVSEVVWLTQKRPKTIHEFWMEAYDQIDTIAAKMTQIQEANYVPVASFLLDESCWTDHFFAPQKESYQHFLDKYPNNQIVKDFIANQQHEANLYDKYKDYYGYAFFIAKKL